MFIYIHKCHSDICHRDKTLITRYQTSRDPHDVTSAQLLIVVWKMLRKDLLAFRKQNPQPISITHIHKFGVCVGVKFVLFNSMLKYVINRLMHAFFHIRTFIIPRPISTLGLKPSGRYRSLGMIRVLIWKRACINL
jgi:hypothetical protein